MARRSKSAVSDYPGGRDIVDIDVSAEMETSFRNTPTR